MISGVPLSSGVSDLSRTLKTVPSASSFFLVDGAASQEVLLEHAICPPTEVHALLGLHAVTDRGDRIEGPSYKAICWLALELSMMYAPSV